MTFDEFKTDALRTESRPEKLNFNLVGLYELLQLGIDVATLFDDAKKTMFYGKPLDVGLFRERLDSIESSCKFLADGARSIGMPDEEQRERMAAVGVPAPETPNLRIAHGVIGMFTEAGELLQAVAKQIEGQGLDLVNLAEETGDSDWYKAIIHDETGVSEEQSRAKVIAKLKARYGEKFSSAAALNRDLTAERKVLETTEA